MSTLWTQVEKQQLLEALRKYGVNDVEKIANALPYKSVCDIRTIISKYENLAIRSLTESSPSKSSAFTGTAPIELWIDIMKQILTRNNHNIISRVLKYISLLEKRTESNINLEECYMVLADLTNGQASIQLDHETTKFFNNCITKLAKVVKANENDRKQTFLDNLEFNKLSATKTYRSKVDNNPLISDVDLNPCKVPANLLTNNKFR